MPSARVLPDWHMRLGFGSSEPYRYYGAALGLLDRLEIFGQYTRVTSKTAFQGEGYGDYKDRAAGLKLLLLREKDFVPQLSLGVFDTLGTSLFASRYLVASKRWGDLDLSLGLGQGALGGDSFIDDTSGKDFLFSTPFRRARPFGGLEWHAVDGLTLVAEYSSRDYQKMFGFRDKKGDRLKQDNSEIPVNFGIKYSLLDYLDAQLAYLRGNTLAGGLNLQFPLRPECMLTWKATEKPTATQRLQWRAYAADKTELSRIAAQKLKEAGFDQAAVASGEKSLWVQARNCLHLSDSRALGHMASILETFLPPRIDTLYLNLLEDNQVVQSLKTSRQLLQDFLASKIDKKRFLDSADLELYGNKHWKDFRDSGKTGKMQKAAYSGFSYFIKPRVRTFLNNRAGFFKHKGLLELGADYRFWRGAKIASSLELTLFNQFDELKFAPLEGDESVRTDIS